MTNRAIQVATPGGEFTLVGTDVPAPGDGQVRITVQACGICHSEQAMVTDLLARSSEFTRLWELGEVASLRSCPKTLRHQHAGILEIQCDVVLSPGTGHRLVMYRPQPGTETAERMDFLRVLGSQELA